MVIDELIAELTKLPGIGRKSATRMTYYLLKAGRGYSEHLTRLVSRVATEVRPCRICGGYTESDTCAVCADVRRDRTVICVVENPQDVGLIEMSQEYHGLYHVLGGVISPLDGVGPDDLRIAPLLGRLDQVSEIIIATNPTVEGDTTAMYLHRLLHDRGVVVSRLALGLPVGGDLEYADRLTLARSLRGRTRFS